jgi:hypothetical protein
MKKTIWIAGLLIFIQGFYACTNEKWSFPDFDYTTSYFPYQYPVRTLVLGDYMFDNTNDNELKFKIGAHMGGTYENKESINVGIALDESMTENLFNSVGKTPIKALPSSYYTLSNSSLIVIPSGTIKGTIDVQLTPALLEDTLAIGNNYVIPLKITSSTTDSILRGRSSLASPDPRVPGDWTVKPKDFTLFGIKYVNEYHGKYLLRGASLIKSLDGSTVENIVYRQKYVEKNTVVPLLTYRKNVVKYSNSIKRSGGSPGSFEMMITFQDNDEAILTNTTRFPQFTITGTGKRVKNAEEWGDKKRHVIYLDYQIKVGTQTHFVKDTLVFRDKGVIFEEYNPVVILP